MKTTEEILRDRRKEWNWQTTNWGPRRKEQGECVKGNVRIPRFPDLFPNLMETIISQIHEHRKTSNKINKKKIYIYTKSTETAKQQRQKKKHIK